MLYKARFKEKGERFVIKNMSFEPDVESLIDTNLAKSRMYKGFEYNDYEINLAKQVLYNYPEAYDILVSEQKIEEIEEKTPSKNQEERDGLAILLLMMAILALVVFIIILPVIVTLIFYWKWLSKKVYQRIDEDRCWDKKLKKWKLPFALGGIGFTIACLALFFFAHIQAFIYILLIFNVLYGIAFLVLPTIIKTSELDNNEGDSNDLQFDSTVICDKTKSKNAKNNKTIFITIILAVVLGLCAVFFVPKFINKLGEPSTPNNSDLPKSVSKKTYSLDSFTIELEEGLDIKGSQGDFSDGYFSNGYYQFYKGDKLVLSITVGGIGDPGNSEGVPIDLSWGRGEFYKNGTRLIISCEKEGYYWTYYSVIIESSIYTREELASAAKTIKPL